MWVRKKALWFSAKGQIQVLIQIVVIRRRGGEVVQGVNLVGWSCTNIVVRVLVQKVVCNIRKNCEEKKRTRLSLYGILQIVKQHRQHKIYYT